MKKVITILAFMFLAIPFIFAQSSEDNTENETTQITQTYVYAEIIGSQKFFSRKIAAEIDYGQKVKFFEDDRIRNEKGKVKGFNSMIDALNYMGERGWELVQTYTVKEGENGTAHHWILKRPVYEDENGDFIPKIRRTRNKKN